MQLTQIPSHSTLGNHFDSRTKWLEGIATVAFSQNRGVVRSAGDNGKERYDEDLRGDDWMLRMARNEDRSQRAELKTIRFGPGTAYIISGPAQGTATVCKQRREGHKNCSCCWTVGLLAMASAAVL